MDREQNNLLKMFKSIAEVFERHGIKYYGMFGTELGTIRHDGFIPWDNDIDLLVFCDDYPYIKKVLNTELDSEKYYFHDPRADCHPHVIMKTDDFETDLKNKKAPFIDIFLYHPYPDGWFRRKFFNGMATMCYISTYVLESFRSLFWYRRFCYIPKKIEKIAKFVQMNDHRYVGHFVPSFREDIFERKDFKEPWMHKFEDTVMPTPMDWEKFLISTFGKTYMEIPPPEERTGAHGYPVDAYLDYLMDKEITLDMLEDPPNKDTTVSIVVPLRNCSDYVYECIRHIRQQTHPNLEVVFVVDPCSDDDTLSKVQNYSDCLNDSKIVEGPYDDAKNIGLDSASGEFVWFANVCDMPSPYYVSEMLDAILETGCDIISCNHYLSYRDMVITPPEMEYKTSVMNGKDAVRKIFRGRLSADSWNRLYRKNYLIENGLRFTSNAGDDCRFSIESLLSSEKVAYLNKPLYTHLLRDDLTTDAIDETISANVKGVLDTIDSLDDETRDLIAPYVLRMMSGTSKKRYRELSSSDMITELSSQKHPGTGIYRMSPSFYRSIIRTTRRLGFVNNDHLFDDSL